jgi:hypothetical protein
MDRVPEEAAAGRAAARSRNAAAAAKPPRACARRGERSSSAATDSSGRGRGVGQMPRPPVRIGVRVGRLGQCPVRCSDHLRRPPDRPRSGPGDDRSARVHLARSVRHPRHLPRRRLGFPAVGGAPQQGYVAGRLGRGGQQQPLRLARKRPELLVEAVSMRLASGCRSGSRKPPASSAGPSPPGSCNRASGLLPVSATTRSRT